MSRGRTAYALAVLFLINAMNFFDRQVLGAVGEQIRKEWNLTDTALGGLGTAFTLIYAFVGLPLGRLSDLIDRKWILSGGVFVWSLLTALSGVCQNMTQLFAARLGVGVGEASCAPAASSLIGDLYPAHKRSNAIAIFMLGLPIGIALSFFVGGAIARDYGWRMAFYVAAVPGIVCSVAAFFIQEPKRGASETHAVGNTKREGSPFFLVLSIPTMWWIIATGALHNFNMYAIGSFLGPLMGRYHKVDIAEAGKLVMIAYGFAGIPGLLLGGMIGDWISHRRKNGRLLLGAITFLISTPLTFLALNCAPGNKMGFLLYMTPGVACMYVYYAATYSTIQDLVEPSLRGMAMAIYFFAMYLLGASMGPIGMGALSDYFTNHAAQAAGALGALSSLTAGTPEYAQMLSKALEPFRGEGLRSAMFVIPIFNLLLTFCMFAASRTVTRDIEKIQLWMRESSAGPRNA